jgi:5'-3' exonuclease
MQPLIDADVLAYESSFAAEAAWKYEGQEGIPPFDKVADILDGRIESICLAVEATQPPTLFLTGKTNFRNDIAKRQKYKDRAGNKPWHFQNILAYMKGKYDYRITEGLEADDLMAIEQTRSLAEGKATIICTRDKDLRQVSGWHYGWELGNQPSFGPEFVEGIGRLELQPSRKLKGTGTYFFYSQCITGDSVDSIPGLPNYGPVKAYEILEGAETEEELFSRVYAAYQVVFGERASEELLEQGRLLWMTRELQSNGQPVLWEFPFPPMKQAIGREETENVIGQTIPSTTTPMKQNHGMLDSSSELNSLRDGPIDT